MSSIKHKRILVTGGAGSIGSELVRQLCKKNKVFILDNNETGTFDLIEELKLKGHWVHGRIGDIRDKDTIKDVMSDFKPQIIFHAAAYKHVTPSQWYPEEYVSTNINGTLNLIREAKRWECFEKFIFISTDKVVNATNVMGMTKKCAEGIVTSMGKGFVAVRFGNVLGSRGSVIPIWQQQIDRNEPLTVTDERMERYMMTIPEACELVIWAARLGKGGEVYVMDMGKPVNVLSLAKQILEKSGKTLGIKMIGLRQGETLDEKLMTKDEEARAVKEGNFYVIH